MLKSQPNSQTHKFQNRKYRRAQSLKARMRQRQNAHTNFGNTVILPSISRSTVTSFPTIRRKPICKAPTT